MPTWGKVRRDKGDRWYIELPGKVRLFCDKEHKTFYSRQHAEFTLAQIHGEIRNGTFDRNFYSHKRKSLLSFSVFAEKWLTVNQERHEAQMISKNHLQHLTYAVNKYFKPFFKDTNILDIRGGHIEDFLLSLRPNKENGFKQLKSQTKATLLVYLHKLFQDAYDREFIPSMPKWPKFSVADCPEPEWTWAPIEVQDKILQHLDPDAAFMIFFQMTHGVRTGEARGLQHQDIDLKNDRVTIARAFGRGELRHTKTNHIRQIPLDPNWKELYLSRPRTLDRQAFVFCSKNGRPRGEAWAGKKWRSACKAAGVSGLTLYAGTRHSFASQAANAGASIWLISRCLGHTNIKTTNRYAHLQVDTLRELQRKGDCQQLASKRVAGE